MSIQITHRAIQDVLPLTYHKAESDRLTSTDLYSEYPLIASEDMANLDCFSEKAMFLPEETETWVPNNIDEVTSITYELYKLQYMIGKELKSVYIVIQRTLQDDQLREGLRSASKMKSYFNTAMQISSGACMIAAGGVGMANGDSLYHIANLISSTLGRSISSEGAQIAQGLSGSFQGLSTLCKAGGEARKAVTDGQGSVANTQKEMLAQRLQQIKNSLDELMQNRNETIRSQKENEAQRSQAIKNVASWQKA